MYSRFKDLQVLGSDAEEDDEHTQQNIQNTKRGRPRETFDLDQSELDALKKFVSLRDKLKKVVVKFHKSPKLSDSMLEKQKPR